MRTYKGPWWFVVVCIVFGLLLSAGAAWAACPGGGFHTSTTDITVGSETDYPSFLAIKISGANPVSSGNCFSTVSPSWSFNLQIHNISDNTARQTQIRFNSLVIKYYDGDGTYLGSTTLNQDDWLTYFDSGNYGGGTFSVPYLLEPGEYCAGCFCAHLGGKASGYLKLVANYTLPNSPGGFPHSIEVPIPPEVIEVAQEGRPMVVPLRGDGTLVFKQARPRGFHPSMGTIVNVERPDQITSLSVNVAESITDQYIINGMPANGSNLSATVDSASELTLSLEEDGTPICTDSGTTTLSCSKSAPDPTKNYVFKLTGGSGGGTGDLTITWQIPSVACGGSTSLAMLDEKDYYFSTNPGGTTDLLHIRAVDVSSGSDVSVGIYANYPYNQTAECTGDDGGAGVDESCGKKDAANQTWYSRVSTTGTGTANFYVECHNKSNATALTRGTALSDNVPEGAWRFYKLTVPSGQELVTASMKPESTSENDNLYIKNGDLPQPSDYDGYRQGGGAGVLEQVMALNPGAGTWYLGVFCDNNTGDGMTVVMDYFDQDTTSSLSDGVSQSVTVEPNEWVFRKIDVPSTATAVKFTVDNVPTGKSVKLYTMKGSFPTIESGKNYCNTTATSSTPGECNHPPNTFGTGTWYVGIFGSGLGSGSASVDLTADITTPPESISNGETKSFSAPASQWQYYAASPGASYDYMKARAHGISNNADLYVKKGAKPTTASYDQRSTNSAGEDEGILIGQVTNDTYDFGLYGNDALTSTGSFTVSWGNGSSLSPGDEQTISSLDNLDYTIYKLTVPASATALGVSETVSSGDLDLYTYAGSIGASPDCSSTTAGTSTESCDHSSPTSGTWFVVGKSVPGTGSSSSGKLISVLYGTSGNLTGRLDLAP